MIEPSIMGVEVTQIASSVFDAQKFWNDVKDFMNHKRMTPKELADLADVDRSNLTTCMLYGKSPSLFYVYRLGFICDLDMNKYMKL